MSAAETAKLSRHDGPDHDALAAIVPPNSREPVVSILISTHRDADGNVSIPDLDESRSHALEMVGQLPAEFDTCPLIQTIEKLSPSRVPPNATNNGLAIYVVGRKVTGFDLPVPVDHTTIAPRPYILPLLPLVSDDSRFFIVCLGRKNFRFLRASRRRVQEEHTQRVPDWFPTPMNVATPLEVSGAAKFEAGTIANQESDDFLRHVDKIVRRTTHNVGEPLFFCGEELLFQRFREVSSHDELQTSFLDGDPDHYTTEKIHSLCWPLIEPVFRTPGSPLLDSSRTLDRAGRLTTQLHEVTALAMAGKVDALYIAENNAPLGVIDPATGGSAQIEPGSSLDLWPAEDLVNAAALLTLQHGGIISVVEASELPNSAPAAAVLRQSLFAE